MPCVQFSRHKDELKKLTFRNFDSQYHESLWQDYENVLMTRTFLLTTSMSLLWVITAILGNRRDQRYNILVSEKEPPINIEAAYNFNPFAKITFYILVVIRFLINIFSIKWPKLLKYYLYIEIMVQMVETFIPVSLSFEDDIMLYFMRGYFFFWLSYFRFWTDLTCMILSLIPFFLIQPGIYP